MTASPKSASPNIGDGLPLPATSGNGIETTGNGFAFATPAAETADVAPATVEYCMYHVPIMTIAVLPERKSLFTSGYCCTPSAPGCMMPLLNIFWKVVHAWTKTGSVHLALPVDALVQRPGWMLSEIA